MRRLQEEYDGLNQEMVESGMLIKLNEEKRPGCFLARSDPDDVARMEERTFVCSREQGRRGSQQQLGRSLPR